MIRISQTLEQDLGRIILRAVGSARDKTARFVVPVGTEEFHVELGLKPLNPHVGINDPIVLNLTDQLSKGRRERLNMIEDSSPHLVLMAWL